MRRFINIEEAMFNLNQREEMLEKLADKIICESTQEEEYDLGKEDFLLKRTSKHSKWGHQRLCNSIVVDNEGVKEKYGFENKVPDLTITLNEDFVYITSDKEGCRIGKNYVKDNMNISKIVTIVKYIIRNGFANLYANKDYAEMTSKLKPDESAIGFYRKHIFFKKEADKIFDFMIQYASKIGFGIEVYNPDHNHGLGLLDQKITLSSSERWNSKPDMVESFVGIEFDEHDLKISFINTFNRIKISSKYTFFEIEGIEEEVAIQMVEILKLQTSNGPIDNSGGIFEPIDFDD